MLRFGILVVAVLMATSAQAMDHRSQYGVGGGLGANFAAPWGDPVFRAAVGPKVPAGSAWARWIAGTPEVGVEVSYNYIALSKMNFSANTAIVSFVSRQNPWGSFHPLYGVGFGYARTSNKFATGDAGVWDDPIVKLTAGIEFELDEHTDVGLRIDHYSIFRDLNTQYAMHMLAPLLTINHYFGTPAPMPVEKPEAAAPAAAPALTPAPAVAPPTPAVKEAPAATQRAQKPSKKSSQAAKKTKKKPAKKKKKPMPDNGAIEPTDGNQ